MRFLTAAALPVALLAFAGSASALPAHADSPPAMEESGYEADAYGDEIDARSLEVERVIATNPDLVARVVLDAFEKDPERFQTLVGRVLVTHPEYVIQSLQAYKAKLDGTAPPTLTPQVIADIAQQAEKNAALRGNPEGSITLVEFSDYNCGYCHRLDPILTTLIEENPQLRIVQRELPILGQDSVDVARLALAAREQGQYGAYHEALMTAEDAMTPSRALDLAREMGLDAEKLENDADADIIAAHIQDSLLLAGQLQLKGTPAMILGDQLIPGLVSQSDLQAEIDKLK